MTKRKEKKDPDAWKQKFLDEAEKQGIKADSAEGIENLNEFLSNCKITTKSKKKKQG